ncbi:hypothetical protein VTN02DRAFT_6664 [Thermoascus thermophilus]
MRLRQRKSMFNSNLRISAGKGMAKSGTTSDLYPKRKCKDTIRAKISSSWQSPLSSPPASPNPSPIPKPIPPPSQPT